MTRLVLLAVLGAVIVLNASELRDLGGGAVQAVLTPPFRWQSRQEMASIAREVQVYERDSAGALPDERRFSFWLNANFQGGSTSDSWGNEYALRPLADSFAIVSWGPDGLPETGDDLRVVRARARPER